ncbi:hypothetical protein [Methylobacterium goesingense]|uniref:Uncharacterized protein n=1 Tax=Methylobacterium goesingense TaxID=243690 RepID=A0ABV2L328_9HYPH|nr:hypothetical protein [Methylobacterium goesingense]GJD76385.1 hypothetical protein CFIICLFH_4641 [Methylobacterium goesingense]
MSQTTRVSDEATLDLLANHCIAARTMIDAVGTPVMRRLVDLLLFEVGVALSAPITRSAQVTALRPVLEPAE